MRNANKVLLLVTGLIALFACASYFVFLPRLNGTEYSSLSELKADLTKVLKQKQPQAPILELGNSWPKYDELTKPENFLPHYEKYDLDEIQGLYKYAKNCEFPEKLKKSLDLKKAWDWQMFLCKRLKLPPDFFAKPPYIHPSGQSYSQLGENAGLGVPKNLKSWIENIRSTPALNQYFGPSDWASLASISQQTDIIFLEKYALLKNEMGNFNIVYRAYDIENVDEFFSHDRPYVFLLNSKKGQNANCLENLERGCWAINSQFESRNRRALNTAMLVAMALSTLLFIVFAVGAMLKRNEVTNDRNFVLRTLAHELRTPIASLSLDVESLRKLFNSVDEDAQKTLLRVFNGVTRLRALVQASERYLSADAGSIKAGSPKEKINLNQHILQLVDSQNYDVEVEIPKDLVVNGSGYWLSLCLQNLIQNALQHGQPPVKVLAKHVGQKIFLDVTDQGKIQGDLSGLIKPFTKGAGSTGLGLGLEIVHKSAALTGAQLILLNSQKTTFRLIWSV